MKLNYFVGSLLVMMCTVGVCTGNGPSISCCTEKDTTPIKAEEIVSYVLENPPCYIGAVRFLLINNRTRCSDPERLWAKRAIKIINIRNTTKAPKTPPSSATMKDTTRSTFSPGTTTDITVTMTTSKVPSSTWEPTTYTNSFSTKQPTEKPPQRTTMQIPTVKTTTKMTTIMDSTPLITDIKTTVTTMAMTTERPVTTTTTVSTSITRERPATYITHTASTEESPRNTRKPQHWTTRQITTITERERVTPETKTTSMTRTTSSTKKLPGNTRKPQHGTTSKQKVTIKQRNTHGTEIILATTAETRVTTTTPKGTSTTKRPEQKSNVTSRRQRCPPLVTKNLDKHKKGKNTSWIIKRLLKKRKQGLRRVQMSPGCIEG
ncbi:mucin-2-like isoform X2 [Hemibagrus wyckioides]|uniref:mucin-2-like isoform X2 n=1 Tax=Hemibagrus wyckioides TaxID=337641 RepID=UPI00266D82E5|nr:mucin-2-like isoform X2 [Hemibagrus wyckioides]